MSNSTNNTAELTAEQVQNVLVQPLQAASLFLAAGPTVINTAGPIRLPKAAKYDGSALGFTGESELIPERDAEFDEIQLMPSTMKSVKVITRYSNELARQSVIALDSAIKDKLVGDVAAKLDAQFFGASGDGITTPRGLFALKDTQSLAAPSALDYDTLIDAWGLALAANVNTQGLKWVMSSADFVALRKIKDAGGIYILQPDVTAAGQFVLFGSPVVISNRVPTGKAALVDFSQVVVAQDLAPSVTILKERYADTDEQAIRVVSRYDVGALNPEAVVVLDKEDGA